VIADQNIAKSAQLAPYISPTSTKFTYGKLHYTSQHLLHHSTHFQHKPTTNENYRLNSHNKLNEVKTSTDKVTVVSSANITKIRKHYNSRAK
jgi:hypothetical protein